MHHHQCRWSQEHLRMLLQQLRVLSFAPGGLGSVWNWVGVLVRLTSAAGRIACGFWTILRWLIQFGWIYTCAEFTNRMLNIYIMMNQADDFIHQSSSSMALLYQFTHRNDTGLWLCDKYLTSVPRTIPKWDSITLILNILDRVHGTWTFTNISFELSITF